MSRKRRTSRCSGQHLRLAQALPLAIGLQGLVRGKGKSIMMVLCWAAQASGKPSLGLVLPLSSSVRRHRKTQRSKFSIMEKMSRDELLIVIRRIMSSDGTEEEINRLTDALEASLPCPSLSDLMFYSKPGLTPEQVLEKALAYKPVALPSKMPE